MLNRRQFLNSSAAGAAFLLPTGVGPLSRRARAAQTSLLAPIPLPGSTLTKYLDPLPIPPVFNTNTNNYLVGMAETVAPVLPRNFRYPAAFRGTTVWSYYDKTNFARPTGTYLGPTVVAYKGVPKTITWYNELPSRFLPTLDSTHYSVVDQFLTGLSGS